MTDALNAKMALFLSRAKTLKPDQAQREFEELRKVRVSMMSSYHGPICHVASSQPQEHQRILEFSDEKLALASKAYDQVTHA